MTADQRSVAGGIAAGGIVGAGAVAWLVGIPAGDATELIAITAVAALGVALAGRLTLLRLQKRSLRTQVGVVVVTAIAAVVAGALVAAKAMFLSAHDRDALLVIAVVATAAALTAALALASTFGADAAVVAGLTRQLGDDPGARPRVAASARIKEMDDLARRLEAVTARLDESRARERALEQSRRELVAWVSHDLRSPLASIRALAEALEDGIVTESADVARYQRSIRVESERLSSLVDDLFELSRVNAGAVAVDADAETVAVGDLVADALAGVTPRAQARGVRVTVDVDDVATSTVPATDMLRVVRNLLDNAIRHTGDGGWVRVEGRIHGDAVVIAVADECGGIPERDLPRVFDVAFRGDAARRRDGSGGGLGLAIAKGLAEAHRGVIDVHNDGPGCRFQVRIPTSVR